MSAKISYHNETTAWGAGDCCGETRDGAHFLVETEHIDDNGGDVSGVIVVHLDCALVMALAQGASMSGSITPEMFKRWYDEASGRATS